MSNYGPIAIVDVSPDKRFSARVAELLSVKPNPTEVAKFKDGETNIRIKEGVRGKDVYIFQSYMPEPFRQGDKDVKGIGERVYELLNAINATQSGGEARRITAVTPYCFGMRGERPTGPRQSTQAVVVAKALGAMGLDKLLTVGLHTESVQSIFLATGEKGVKVEHLSFEPIAANYIINTAKKYKQTHIVIASPDTGGTKRARQVRAIVDGHSDISVDLAIGDKQRRQHDKAEILEIIGDVRGKDVYLYDDMGDTMNTLYGAAQAIKERGAKSIYLVLIHPVLGKNYEQNLDKLCNDRFIKEIVFGNTIPIKERALKCPKLRMVPLEPFVAEAISRINHDQSMSELHDYDKIMELYEKSKMELDERTIQIGRLERLAEKHHKNGAKKPVLVTQ